MQDSLLQQPSLFPPDEDARDRLLAAYRPLSGIHDELMAADQTLRPHWTPLIDAFAGLGRDDLERRFASADRHMRDTGVVHRVYDAHGGSERPLPLAHVPLLIAPEDWAGIEAAAIQRAELLGRVLADIYGPQELIRDGSIPASLIAGNPEFQRAMVGVTPAGGTHLRVYAADIGRGPDGRWWVLRDRTQAPSGAGYTVENRIALSRALPEIYRVLKVSRLAGFFEQFRDELNRLNRTPNLRVGLLSPGAFNESAFEQAYLARYLGLLLLEGDDLTVRDGQVFVRTIEGLQPVEVLLRRLDSDYADPLAFNAASRIGVPGLARAARDGNVAIVNALGSGAVESAGLMGFMPGLARRLLGEDLRMPNVATWWCGQPDVRDAVMPELDSRVVAPAYGYGLPVLPDRGATAMSDVTPEVRETLRQAIRARGCDYVVQEAIHLSTMPVWDDGALHPRPFVLRVFATRTEDGWRVMPGGFCRVSQRADSRAVSLQHGGAVSDVWVMNVQQSGAGTLLPPPVAPIRVRTDVLPSRTAENLYWLGRYIERAESCARLVRALASRLVELNADEDPLVQTLLHLLENAGALPPQDPEAGPYCVLGAGLRPAILDPRLPGGLPAIVASALACASKTRDRVSPDAWRALRDLEALVAAPPQPLTEEAIFLHCTSVLRLMSAFAGLSQHNMNRRSGWRFLQLGVRLERAATMAVWCRRLGDPAAPPGSLETLLELGDSQISFRSLYADVPARAQVMDLLILDTVNPRSLAFQAQRIEEHVLVLPDISDGSTPSKTRRAAISINAALKVIGPREVDNGLLEDFAAALYETSDAIGEDYFIHQGLLQNGFSVS